MIKHNHKRLIAALATITVIAMLVVAYRFEQFHQNQLLLTIWSAVGMGLLVIFAWYAVTPEVPPKPSRAASRAKKPSARSTKRSLKSK